MTGSEKRRARKQSQHSVLIQGRSCARCGEPATDRHHPGHSKPLTVVPLCRTCHINLHAGDLHESGKRSAETRWKNRDKTRACVQCGKLFTYMRPRQTACSQTCANRAAWARRTDVSLQKARTDGLKYAMKRWHGEK